MRGTIDRLKEALPPISEIVPGLKQKTNNELAGPCPWCGGNDRFVVFLDSGRFLCRGCRQGGGDIIDFYCQTEGLDISGLEKKFLSDAQYAPEQPTAQRKTTDRPLKLIQDYDYTDEAGKLLLQVRRFEPKTFRQRCPDGNGGWINSTKGVRKVLYHLPELAEAKSIIIVEGEKDADSLRAIGFTATSAAGGAGNWLPVEELEVLRGKDVTLIPDNDEPGRDHMHKVAASLAGIAASVRWLEIPNLPPKGDVSDYIASFDDRETAEERLAIMISEATVYQAPKAATIDDAVLTIDQLKSINIPERRCLLLPWLKEASITFLSGWRGSGKTWMAVSILQAISTGGSFGPWQCGHRVPTLFMDGELPTVDIRERINNLGAKHDPDHPIYIFSDAFSNQLGLPRAHLANEKWRQEMKRVLLSKHIGAWVVDNIASLASGLDENKKQDWDPINQWLLELRFAGISSILLHHTGKMGQQRGTSAREDNADCSILLKKPHDYVPEDGCRFIVSFDKARVSQQHLSLIADTEFKLIEKTEGSTWEWGNVKKQRNKEIMLMLDEGHQYDAIKDALGCSKAYISQVKNKAIKDGHLTKEGKLTQSGFLFCRGTLDD